MLMDGAGWHCAHELVVPENMTLMLLPPYSPELNPVEHIWKEFREKGLKNKVFKSLDGVEKALVDIINSMEKDTPLVNSVTGFPWIINSSLNTTWYHHKLHGANHLVSNCCNRTSALTVCCT